MPATGTGRVTRVQLSRGSDCGVYRDMQVVNESVGVFVESWRRSGGAGRIREGRVVVRPSAWPARFGFYDVAG